MADPTFSICVYCGSRAGILPEYEQAAVQVGHWIGERGGQLVYGGGRSGLMGAVAKATAIAGGRVVGVIPQSLVDKEHANRNCDELHIVQTMHERKALMAERSQAFLALPGGIGTLEELFEAWTWSQLGYHDKPIALLDVADYYAPLLRFLAGSVSAGFMGPLQMGLVQTGSQVSDLLARLIAASAVGDHPNPLLRDQI